MKPGHPRAACLQALVAARARVLLVGPPGCGKTARVHAAFTAEGIPLKVWRPSIMERVDVSGIIVPDTERGVARQLPLEDLSWFSQATPQAPRGLFLDDLGQAPLDVQASLMRLFERETFSPDRIIIWGATNRPHDKAGVSTLCEPLRSRFDCAFSIPLPDGAVSGDSTRLSSWEEELNHWIQWAMDAGLPSELIAFHRVTGGIHLYAWKPTQDPGVRLPDYRSNESLGRLWNAGLKDEKVAAATIGKGAAAALFAFLEAGRGVPTPEEVFSHPEQASVPENGSGQTLVATALAARVTAATVRPFLRYIARLPRPVTALAARDAYRRLGAALSSSPEWLKWFRENSDLFSV